MPLPAPLACLPSPYQQPLRSPRLPRPGLHPSPASFPFAPKPPGPAHPLRSAPRHPVRLPCQPPSLTPLPQLRCQPPSRTPFPQLRFPRAGSPFHPVPPAATQLSRTRDAPFPLPMASRSCYRSNVLPSPNISATPPDPFAVCPCSFSCHPCPPSPPHPALLRPCRLSPAPLPSPTRLAPLRRTCPPRCFSCRPCPLPPSLRLCYPSPRRGGTSFELPSPNLLALYPPPSASPPVAPGCSKLPRPCSFSTLAARAHPPSLSPPSVCCPLPRAAARRPKAPTGD